MLLASLVFVVAVISKCLTRHVKGNRPRAAKLSRKIRRKTRGRCLQGSTKLKHCESSAVHHTSSALGFQGAFDCFTMKWKLYIQVFKLYLNGLAQNASRNLECLKFEAMIFRHTFIFHGHQPLNRKNFDTGQFELVSAAIYPSLRT